MTTESWARAYQPMNTSVNTRNPRRKASTSRRRRAKASWNTSAAVSSPRAATSTPISQRRSCQLRFHTGSTASAAPLSPRAAAVCRAVAWMEASSDMAVMVAPLRPSIRDARLEDRLLVLDDPYPAQPAVGTDPHQGGDGLAGVGGNGGDPVGECRVTHHPGHEQ